MEAPLFLSVLHSSAVDFQASNVEELVTSLVVASAGDFKHSKACNIVVTPSPPIRFPRRSNLLANCPLGRRVSICHGCVVVVHAQDCERGAIIRAL